MTRFVPYPDMFEPDDGARREHIRSAASSGSTEAGAGFGNGATREDPLIIGPERSAALRANERAKFLPERAREHTWGTLRPPARLSRKAESIVHDRKELAAAIIFMEARLEDWPTADLDDALDFYSQLRDTISGRVTAAKGFDDLQAASSRSSPEWQSRSPRTGSRWARRSNSSGLTIRLPRRPRRP